MGQIYSEVCQVAKSLAIQFRVVDKDMIRQIKMSAIAKFGRKGDEAIGEPFLWDRLNGGEAIHDANGWKLIPQFDVPKPIILFFDERVEAVGFHFENFGDITSVVGHSFGFDFYICDKSVDFLIAFNDHDVLIGYGRAEAWVKSLKK